LFYLLFVWFVLTAIITYTTRVQEKEREEGGGGGLQLLFSQSYIIFKKLN